MKEKYRLSSKFGMINCKSLRGISLTHEALFFKSLILTHLNLILTHPRHTKNKNRDWGSDVDRMKITIKICNILSGKTVVYWEVISPLHQLCVFS